MKCIKSNKNAKDKIRGKTLKLEEVKLMIKKIAWETFKNTGNINTFMELKQIENIEREMANRSLKSLEEGFEKIPLIENDDQGIRNNKEDNKKWQM